MTVHICAPPATETRRMIRPCPTCKHRRRFVARFYEWYGWYLTCCHCGDQWADGERLLRPFKPGWRREASAKAKQIWERSKET